MSLIILALIAGQAVLLMLYEWFYFRRRPEAGGRFWLRLLLGLAGGLLLSWLGAESLGLLWHYAGWQPQSLWTALVFWYILSPMLVYSLLRRKV